jgi:hypothetical protein
MCDIILEVDKSYQRYVDIKVNLQQGMSQHEFEGYEQKRMGSSYIGTESMCQMIKS